MARFETLSPLELERAVAEILRKHLPGFVGETLPNHADLRELGLDSLRFVWVLADLDRDLELEIPDELFDFENFRTLAIALETVARAQQASRP